MKKKKTENELGEQTRSQVAVILTFWLSATVIYQAVSGIVLQLCALDFRQFTSVADSV